MKANTEPLSRAAVPHVTQTRIVCGDCSGDALVPVKTLLTADGNCSRCAGRNYVLAANITNALLRYYRKGDVKR